jgi:hypothetical protein
MHKDKINQVRETKTTKDTSCLKGTSLQWFNQYQNQTKSKKAYLDESI